MITIKEVMDYTSGQHNGGVIQNRAQVLCDLLVSMHDSNGVVTLPDFYSDVQPIDHDERQSFSKLPIDELSNITQTGVPNLCGGEKKGTLQLIEYPRDPSTKLMVYCLHRKRF
jgi:hypothetical protein